MKMTIYLLIVLFVPSLQAVAQTGEEELCDYSLKVNKELDSIYNMILKISISGDKVALKKSQMEWKKYRNSNCKFIGKRKGGDGIIENKIRLDCIIQETERRKKELEGLMIE